MSKEDKIEERAKGILDGLNKDKDKDTKKNTQNNTKNNVNNDTKDNTQHDDTNNSQNNTTHNTQSDSKKNENSILGQKTKVEKNRYNHYLPVWQNEKLKDLSENTGHSKSKIVEIALSRLFEEIEEESE